jgi:KRAB domain-containing zinc finger protein
MKLFHSDSEPVSCDLCGKSFKSKQYLKNHKETHGLVPNYKCHLCESEFMQKNNLKKHVKYVHDKRSFKCNICNKSYSREDTFKKHKLNHQLFVNKETLKTECIDRSTTFNCDQCNKSYSSEDTLKKHKLNHQLFVNKETVTLTECTGDKKAMETDCSGEIIYNLHPW